MVCGDKALGYNFNAVTCESCKAFFRRNALSNKEFTCPFNENCEITVVTRRFCQKCRLEKCFKIGMKKEYIMSEEDKVLKRKKIEQNRAKKRAASGGNETGPPFGAGGVKIKKEYASENDSWSNQDYANSVPSPESSHNYEMYSCLSLDSSAEEIVNGIVNHPNQSSQKIDALMKTPKDTLYIMTKIIKSPSDCLKLISHFITSPGDALQIISKIMNSPLDALTGKVRSLNMDRNFGSSTKNYEI
jgi:nuclear receptor subfamily 1 group I